LRPRRQRAYDRQKAGYTGDLRRVETVLCRFSGPDIRGSSPYLFFLTHKAANELYVLPEASFLVLSAITLLHTFARFFIGTGPGRRLSGRIQFSKLGWCYPQ
jgi:hypothetical protein